MHDLAGLEAEGAPDRRPWLHHRAPYPFLTAEGEGLHQIAVGPVHAGIIEPGHFRFSVNGETVVRLEQRLGYAHKGIDALMSGASLERAATLAGRVSGDSTVAYALAFAQATEQALGAPVPARAVWLRALAGELERLANHLGDIGAVCNDASLSIMHASCGFLREQVLRTSHACFGHRLMMDLVVPGGVRRDLTADGAALLTALVAFIRNRFPELVDLYENTASLKDRTVGTGVLSPALARQFAAGGYVGRASGRHFDARRTPGYAPYGELRFDVPSVQAGDVNARVWIRIQEVEQSLALVEQIIARLPAGATCNPVPAGAGEGLALVEGFRGDIFAWVRLGADGRVERSHLRDPSWFQWPLLEAAIEGNIVADFPICNKSFNCSYSGHDL
jgi:Ni,Fe-hydrogenase III large subunit